MIMKMVMRMKIVVTVGIITIMVILMMTRRWLMVMIVIYSCFH